MMAQDYLERLVEFVADTRFEDLPPDTIAAARDVVLDTLGAITAGSRLDENANFARLAADMSGPGKSGIGPLMRYALSLPVTAAVVGMPKLDFIRENVEVARNFEPMPASEMESYSQRMSDLNKHAMDVRFCCHVDA